MSFSFVYYLNVTYSRLISSVGEEIVVFSAIVCS